MNTVREIQKLNDLELKKKIPLSASWHAQYLRSPWVFVGGLDYELTEGDVICVMSQVKWRKAVCVRVWGLGEG
jgi:hypothetical protein